MPLPRDLILPAFKEALELEVPEVDGKPKWKVRHERFRPTAVEEMPCVAIRYLGDDATGVSRPADEAPSTAEEVFELRVELVIDAPLPPESDVQTAGDPDEGVDPTGLSTVSAIVETTLATMFTEGEPVNTLGGLIWDARYDGTGDEGENATSNNVRLSERLTLVYRVRAEAPHVLLIGD